MTIEEKLRKYARLIVRKGANVQKDQVVVIRGSIDASSLIRLIANEAYLASAKDVIVDYSDPYISHDHLKYCSDDVLSSVPEYVISKSNYLVDNNACFISITSPISGINKDIDSSKFQLVVNASEKALRKQRDYLMSNYGQWTIAGYPNKVWAKNVFKDLDEDEAFDKLLDAILLASRVDENDPVENWNKHNARLTRINNILNDYCFKSLHFKNSLGTDIEVGLADDHIWAGGEDQTVESKVYFNPNIPTEENFTMPHKLRVNGKVVSTKPLDFHGKLIEDFYLIFKDGEVVEFNAKKEKDCLETMLNLDPGARRIGEIALIPHDSPISNSNILFYDTLYDENASCHMALGRAYPINIKDGASMSSEELEKRGYNNSMIHVDFMFGSKDMTVTGFTHDGKKVEVFKNGNFVI